MILCIATKIMYQYITQFKLLYPFPCMHYRCHRLCIYACTKSERATYDYGYLAIMNFHKLILTQTVGSSMAGTLMAVPLSL